jgi:hypothetical protein
MSYTLIQSQQSGLQSDFLRRQPEINEEMRTTLIIWMMKLQGELRLHQSTLCLAVYLVDRHCCHQNITKNKFQLLGVTCLFMAAKFEELVTPRIHPFIESCHGLYSLCDIIQM